MSRDFRYKDYVNKLRFKLAGAVCPVGLDEYWDKLNYCEFVNNLSEIVKYFIIFMLWKMPE